MELLTCNDYPGLPKELQYIIFNYVGWDWISASQTSFSFMVEYHERVNWKIIFLCKKLPDIYVSRMSPEQKKNYTEYSKHLMSEREIIEYVNNYDWESYNSGRLRLFTPSFASELTRHMITSHRSRQNNITVTQFLISFGIYMFVMVRIMNHIRR